MSVRLKKGLHSSNNRDHACSITKFKITIAFVQVFKFKDATPQPTLLDMTPLHKKLKIPKSFIALISRLK